MDYKKSLPTSSNDPIFNLIECYLSDFEEGEDGYPNEVYVDPFERDQFITELFGNGVNYLGQDLFYTSGVGCSAVESEETATFEVVAGDNQFKPFLNSVDPNLQIPINESDFLQGTAGTTLDTADIIWQFTDNCLEGAWLKSSSQEPIQDTMCWRINPRNNEMRFPYPYKGSVGSGLEWTGKGINNCFVTPYVNPELKAINEEVDSLYWGDTSTTTSCDSIALNSSSLIDDGAHASNNLFMADQVKKRSSREETTGEEVAWLYQPTGTQLPITCGDNLIYYPLFKYEEGKTFNFSIDTNQVEDRNLLNEDIRRGFRGAKAGLTADDADQFFKLNGECGESIEGAWLKGSEFSHRDVTNTSQQNSFMAIFTSESEGNFTWQFPDIEADQVINGFEHDEGCAYLDIENYDEILRDNINNEGNQWEECTCKAVHYSPIGNNLDNFEDYENFSDIIYEDTTDNYNLTDWRDSEGNNYKNSPRFAVFMRSDSGVENSDGVSFAGIGNWNTLVEDVNGDYTPFVLEKGRKYVYKRANFGGCSDQTIPCLVFNNSSCFDGCQEEYPNPAWYKLTQDSEGNWVEAKDENGNDVVTNMTLESNEYYKYVRRKNISYDIEFEGETITRTTPIPAFNINITYDDMRPYWAESPSLGGLNYGLTAFDESEKYLLNTQPKPSEMILTDDCYLEYYRNVKTPFEWKQPLSFTVDFEIPDVWKKIEFSFINPNLLKKIVGCGSCEMVFDESPVNSCYLSQDGCDAFIANIKATDEDSDMIIRNSTDCSDETLIYYKAINSFQIEQRFTTTQTTGGYNYGEYLTSYKPWRNLLNGGDNVVKYDQREGRLLSDREIGIFKPRNVGVNKLYCDSTYDFKDDVCD